MNLTNSMLLACTIRFFTVISKSIFRKKMDIGAEIEVDTEKWKCLVCDRQYKCKKGLKQHLKYHAEKTYKCAECGKSFFYNYKLKRHMKTQHK